MKNYYRLYMTEKQRDSFKKVQAFLSQYKEAKDKDKASLSITFDKADVESFLSISEKNIMCFNEFYMKISQCCEEIGTIPMSDKCQVYFDKDGSLVYDDIDGGERLIDMNPKDIENLYWRIVDECRVHIKPKCSKVLNNEPDEFFYVRVCDYINDKSNVYYIGDGMKGEDLSLDYFTSYNDACDVLQDEVGRCVGECYITESICGEKITILPEKAQTTGRITSIVVKIGEVIRAIFSIGAV